MALCGPLVNVRLDYLFIVDKDPLLHGLDGQVLNAGRGTGHQNAGFFDRILSSQSSAFF
jgi:hypothetical protein